MFYYWEEFNNNNELWKKLINFQKCVKCLKTHETSMYKPYCSSCYIKVKYEDIEIQKIVLKQFQSPLRCIFNKLVLPSGEKKHFNLCKICNKNHCENLFYWNLSTTNKYKHVCYFCLFDSLKNNDQFMSILNQINEIRKQYL